jgi:hypothetical protein
MRRLAQNLANSGIEAGADAVVGEVAPAIAEFADQESVDLIVMATHARRGPARVLLGSVAPEVVRTARQPVLLIGRDAARTADSPAYVGVPTSAVRNPQGFEHDDDRHATVNRGTN